MQNTIEHRNISNKINRLLEMFPAVAILGARQCGKTTLSKALKPNWLYVDMEKPSDFNRIDLDPELFFSQNNEHVIINEAQISSRVFEVLRGVIDSNRKQAGRFILTGSSSPELLSNISESLAGRVAIVELGTLKANELFGTRLSEFYNIFEASDPKQCLTGISKPELSLRQMQIAWYQGGYPEPVLEKSKDFYLQWMENYENTYIYRDIARLYPKLNKVAYQRFLTMLCKLSGTIINKADVARALEVSEGSIREYLNIANGTFLWRTLPSYEKSKAKSIVKMPKGYIRDSGLLHMLLRITDVERLYSDPVVGNSFEGFVIEEIIKGLSSLMLTHYSGYYYRTRGGAEIDLILDGPFGTIPIEIKYSSTVTAKKLKHMENFLVENNLPFGILINQSSSACWLKDNIFQLPVNYL